MAEAAPHVTSEALIDYVSETLSPRLDESLERHLGVCRLCAGEGRRVEDLWAAWALWTARAHGMAAATAVAQRTGDHIDYSVRVAQALGRAETIYRNEPAECCAN